MPAAPGNASVERETAADIPSDAAPDAQAVLALARTRLARELKSLPPWGSPMLRARLFATQTPESGVSHGALVHFIRHAIAQGDTSNAHDLFTLLLQRIEGLNRRWAARTLASGMQNMQNGHEELRQELALRLWIHIGRDDNEAWELFFQRALTFEQRRLGARFLDHRERMRQPTSAAGGAPTQSLGVRRSDTTPTQPARQTRNTWNTFEQALRHSTSLALLPTLPLAELADRRDPFAAAELADLRSHVALLPIRERQATLLRFWCDASEAEIARALGGVTTRTVRNLLTRAYIRLRSLYAPEGNEQGDPLAPGQQTSRVKQEGNPYAEDSIG